MKIDLDAAQMAFVEELVRAHARGALDEAAAIERDYDVECEAYLERNADGDTVVGLRAYRQDESTASATVFLPETSASLGRKVRLMLDAMPPIGG